MNMKRTRRNHSPKVKAAAALDALKGEKTLSEIGAQYGVHPNQIQRWKKQLIDQSVDLFGKHEKAQEDQERQIEKLRAKVGELTMERDFLSKALGR